MKNKIKSQREANQVNDYLIATTVVTTGCDRAQAEKRVNALFKSGILKGGNPNDPETQRKINEFMFTQID